MCTFQNKLYGLLIKPGKVCAVLPLDTNANELTPYLIPNKRECVIQLMKENTVIRWDLKGFAPFNKQPGLGLVVATKSLIYLDKCRESLGSKI
jgi:hypothetical protein